MCCYFSKWSDFHLVDDKTRGKSHKFTSEQYVQTETSHLKHQRPLRTPKKLDCNTENTGFENCQMNTVFIFIVWPSLKVRKGQVWSTINTYFPNMNKRFIFILMDSYLGHFFSNIQWPKWVGDNVLSQGMTVNCLFIIFDHLCPSSLFQTSRSDSNRSTSGQGHLVVWTPISCSSVLEHVPLTRCCIPWGEDACTSTNTKESYCQHAMFRKGNSGTDISVCRKWSSKSNFVYFGFYEWSKKESFLFRCCECLNSNNNQQ